MPTLYEINQMDKRKVKEELQRCCGSSQWVEKMVEYHPFRDGQQIFQLAREIWSEVDESDWREAFSHHPEIGDLDSLKEKFASTESWSSQEQAGVEGASEEVLREFQRLNRAYKEKFGYIFIVCATGKGASEMLEMLKERLENSPEEEIAKAAREQAKITRIRLEKLIESPIEEAEEKARRESGDDLSQGEVEKSPAPVGGSSSPPGTSSGEFQTSLTSEFAQRVLNELGEANREYGEHYPGESSLRQPISTVYGGAHLFKADSAEKIGKVSLRIMENYAANFVHFARALHLPGWENLPTSLAEIDDLTSALEKNPEIYEKTHEETWLAYTIYQRVKEKLKREALEDFRIDFEDGYGNRPRAEEDGHAASTAREVARGMREGTLPPFIGIRIKPFNEELKKRGMRTLDIFLTTLLEETDGQLPENFVITIPKVVIVEQVDALVQFLEAIERKNQLEPGTLELELMIETPQSIINAEGKSNLPLFLEASQGRCRGAHFGVYDYTALTNITASYQDMDHPVCDFARHMMQVALAGTGVWLSDGATNVIPVGPHRASKEGPGLTEAQKRENREVVHRAWRLCSRHIQHSLRHGYYQGWDLHPAQLPIRYATVYNFFLSGLKESSLRLKTFIEKAAQATLVGDVFDDAATGQALLNFFLRGINCGAITEEEATETGLTIDELRTRSFLKILEKRKKI